MKEQALNPEKTNSRANATAPFIQAKTKKKSFFNRERSENNLFSKSVDSFSSEQSSGSNQIQRKSNKNLPKEFQTEIESSLGHDVSNVKIQKDSQEAVKLNARAFTQGNAIHFAPNEFNPHSNTGKELIGHEFAHVKQQREGRVKSTVQTKRYAINDDTTLENEADSFGKDIARKNSSKGANLNKSNLILSKNSSQTVQKRDVEYINYNTVAKDIHDAIDRPGTDEEKVYFALSKMRRNPIAIKKLKATYKSKYKSDLVADLNGDFSGSELAHVKSLLATGETADIRKVKTINYSKVAAKIHKAISGPGTDEEAVYQALLELNNNPVLIKKLKKEYKSKYKVELYTDIVGDFSGDELNYALELLRDKTAKEQVNVSSKTEATDAKKIIKAIKDDYGIDINSKAGVDAIKKRYTLVPKKVLDQLNTTAWEYKELVALKAALDNFSPILGAKRKTSKRKGAAQEVTTVGKVDQGIDSNSPTAKLDTITMGEYFKGSTNFSLFTTGTDDTSVFPDNKKNLTSNIVHEISHGLFRYKLADFTTKMTYWTDLITKSGVAGAEAPITTYGKNNASEDLSEAIKYYFVEPATLKTKCPKRHAYIKAAIKNWK